MKNVLSILTPENVYIEYELAGLGSRFISVFVDHVLQFIIICLFYVPIILFEDYIKSIMIFDLFSLYNSILFIIILIVMFGYFVFFDIVLLGRSPGKFVLGLKVIKENGNPINILDSFLRNIIRAAYLLPILYLVDGIFILLNKKNKRFGDYLSNTVVVKIEKRDIKSKLILLQNIEESHKDDLERSKKIAFRINGKEYRILKDFISRYNEIGTNVKDLELELKRYFEKKFDVEVRDIDSYKFLKEVYKVGIKY
ncbi:MAG: RDD family protein [Clostridiales bacterium]